MPRCTECDRDVEAGVIFCPDCGGEVPAAKPPVGEGAGSASDQLIPDREAGGAVAPAPADEGGEAEPVDEPPTTDVDGPSPFERGPLSFAVTYPLRQGSEAILYGGVAELIGAIVPLFQLPVRGHGFRLAGAAARGQSEPPAFDDVGDLLADGLRWLAVVLAYVLVVGAVAGAAWYAGRTLVVGRGAEFAALVALLGAYPLPASLTAAAATRSVGAAFSPTTAGAFATSGPYAKALLLWLLASLAIGLLGLAALLTIVGAFFVVAWATYVTGSLWGYYYRQAVAKGVVPAPPDEPIA